MRTLLAERSFPVTDIRFFASARSAGKTLDFQGTPVVVEDTDTADFTGLDVALFSNGKTASLATAPKVVAAGAIVIDNSSAWRMDPEVPLVVSEVNPEDAIRPPKGIIANPNCTTMAAMPVLSPLHRQAGLTRLQVATYQAVSGSGGAGVAELDTQVKAVAETAAELAFDGRAVTFPEPDEVRQDDRLQRAAAGRLDRRRRQRRDRRGAEAPQRVPQDPAHPRPAGGRHLRPGARVHRALAGHPRRVREADQPRARRRALLADAPGVALMDVPTPLDAAGQDPSYVGRIRTDQSVPDGRGLVLFVSNDNLRKGAALNAVQIAELLGSRLVSDRQG